MPSPTIESPLTRSAKVSPRPSISSGSVTVSGVSTGSIGTPAATRPRSGTVTARLAVAGPTTSSARLWCGSRLIRRLRCRFRRCLCTVAREASRK